ncbi:metal ABC transporter solute-binding protein, Zn/Mn family [Zavarzinia sp.]|uniref:metal ABC transporter solute-binding protein, Zn/Mn family n=1 Tax=Zavarzinia sp. TaxID=2027920 RepID=UPI0035687531
MLKALVVALGLVATPALAAPVKVVATFSILGDMVAEVGGERVSVTTLVGPDGDAHVFQPSPGDARAVAAADLIVENGLGLEGWMERLAEASGYKGRVAVVSEGVKPRTMVEEEGGTPETITDPHAWQDLGNGERYVANIAAALSAADPAGAATYAANAAAYTEKLKAEDAKVRAAMAALPADRRRIITTHDAFGYFAAAYGLEILAPEGISTDSEASAAGIARLIEQIRETKVPAVFLENVTDPRMMQEIAKETGARIGGTLYSDALSDAKGPAPTYIDMFENNVAQLAAALGS